MIKIIQFLVEEEKYNEFLEEFKKHFNVYQGDDFNTFEIKAKSTKNYYFKPKRKTKKYNPKKSFWATKKIPKRIKCRSIIDNKLIGGNKKNGRKKRNKR